MDWQAFSDGTCAWFAALSGIPLGDVTWKGVPMGYSGSVSATLSVLAHAAVGGTDELRIEAQGIGVDALVRATGNRAFTLSCQVRTRNQSPTGRAYLVLERVRDGLYLPSSQAFYASVGVGLVGTAAFVESDRTFDMRQESQATLDIKLTAALDSLAGAGETLGTIESVITARV
jgi:hypothetical protein